MAFSFVAFFSKPLTAEGLNTSLLIALRNCCHNKFNDSLLEIIQFSLCNGPIYFDCHPNLSVSSLDRNIFDVLTLNLQLHGYDMKIDSEHVNLTYRMYYKVMNTLSPRAHMYDCKDKTILLEINLLKSDVAIPRTIMWMDITPPSSWILDVASPSKPDENKKVKEILQFDDGGVIIKFDNNRTARLSTSSRNSFKTRSERFYTLAHTNIAESSKQTEFQTPSPSLVNTTSKVNNLVFEGVLNSKQNIPHGVYHPVTTTGSENQVRNNEPDTISGLGVNFAGLGIILNL